ncbi:MAG: transposase, partial [bacterium]
IRLHLDMHPKVKKEVKLLETIAGVGWITSVLLTAIMAGGARFKSAREAAAYVGLSVRENQSGNFCGRSRLSKQGPPEIRKALYWPAITAIRHNPDVIDLYNRLTKRGKCNMVVIGAAMRKLVHIAFGVLKHGTKYTAQVA